uniref:Major facilitator superfamily (MFS) profile domain-containing protein n=1 Tax=Panagrolaimus davidi TaxID=227884 RepID=A0A914PYM0_9BILA
MYHAWASYGSIAALVGYMALYGVGSPIPWMITAELFNTKFRSAAVTVAVFTAWTFAFIISTAYLPFQQLVGVAFSYLPFIIISCISIVFIIYFCSEIRFRGQSISIMQPFRTVPSDLALNEGRRLLPPENFEDDEEENPQQNHENYQAILP